jgi:hypothetical protein
LSPKLNVNVQLSPHWLLTFSTDTTTVKSRGKLMRQFGKVGVFALVILPQIHSCLFLNRTSKRVGCAVHWTVKYDNDLLRSSPGTVNWLKNFSRFLQESEEKENMYRVSCFKLIQTCLFLFCWLVFVCLFIYIFFLIYSEWAKFIWIVQIWIWSLNAFILSGNIKIWT